MDEENNNPNLQPFQDPALEARIVADILGESSPFEKAELQTLLNSTPELKAFLSRIESTHESLTNAQKPATNWKLPTEKRQALLRKLRTTTPEQPPHPSEPPKRSISTKLAPWLAAAAALMLLAGSFFTIGRRDFKSATSIVAAPATEEPESFVFADYDIPEIPPDDPVELRIQLAEATNESKITESNGGLRFGRTAISPDSYSSFSRQPTTDNTKWFGSSIAGGGAAIPTSKPTDSPVSASTLGSAQFKRGEKRLYATVDEMLFDSEQALTRDHASFRAPAEKAKNEPDSLVRPTEQSVTGGLVDNLRSNIDGAQINGRSNRSYHRDKSTSLGFLAAKEPATQRGFEDIQSIYGPIALSEVTADFGLDSAPNTTHKDFDIAGTIVDQQSDGFGNDNITAPPAPEVPSLTAAETEAKPRMDYDRAESQRRTIATAAWEATPETEFLEEGTRFLHLAEPTPEAAPQNQNLWASQPGTTTNFSGAADTKELPKLRHLALQTDESKDANINTDSLELLKLQQQVEHLPALAANIDRLEEKYTKQTKWDDDGTNNYFDYPGHPAGISLGDALDQSIPRSGKSEPVEWTYTTNRFWGLANTDSDSAQPRIGIPDPKNPVTGAPDAETIEDGIWELDTGIELLQEHKLGTRFYQIDDERLSRRLIEATTTYYGTENREPPLVTPQFLSDARNLRGYDYRETGPENDNVSTRWDDSASYVDKRVWGGHGGVRLFSNDFEGINKEFELSDFALVNPSKKNLRIEHIDMHLNWEEQLSIPDTTRTYFAPNRNITDLLAIKEKKLQRQLGESREEMLSLMKDSGIVDMGEPAPKWLDPENENSSGTDATLSELTRLDAKQSKGNRFLADEKRRSREYLAAKTRYESLESKLGNVRQQIAKQKAKSPKPKPAPTQETQTTNEPASTFSLNVSDVSFKLAKTALLENNTFPEPEKIRTEEFVNAFDYGDPTPSLEEKIACQIEQATHPFLQQRNLMRVSMSTAAAGRAATQPLRLTILLDKSGSMERADREESVLRTMQALAKHLGPADKISAIAFARQPHLIADQLSGNRAEELVGLVAATPSAGGTNLEEALKLADTLATRQFDDNAINRIILITDGAANLGDADPESLKQKVIALRERNIAFDACGVGADGLNDATLEALTRKGDGRYYLLDRPDGADANFISQLAGSLRPAAKNVKVQVKFNPDRVPTYRLIGFEKHRLEKEDFRNDKVDAAEIAAAESGNAIYQFQPDPQGTGDIGQVSVRFLDTDTGKMVERTWPIPYQPDAPRLTEAKPSLQLAATAAFLAEKLKAGPTAAPIQLSDLTQITNQLRSHPDQNVQSLIQMVEKARQLTE